VILERVWQEMDFWKLVTILIAAFATYPNFLNSQRNKNI